MTVKQKAIVCVLQGALVAEALSAWLHGFHPAARDLAFAVAGGLVGVFALALVQSGDARRG